MNSDLYCLIYTSSAWNDMQAEDIRALASRSSANNKSKNISGVLLYHDRTFFQILEGPESNVLALYDLIQRDRRHYGAFALYDGVIQRRNFSNWGMAVTDISAFAQEDADLFRSLVDAGPQLGTQSAMTSRIERLISSFRKAVGAEDE
jgi:hypothetical protein